MLGDDVGHPPAPFNGLTVDQRHHAGPNIIASWAAPQRLDLTQNLELEPGGKSCHQVHAFMEDCDDQCRLILARQTEHVVMLITSHTKAWVKRAYILKRPSGH